MKFKINFLLIIILLVIIAFGFRYYSEVKDEIGTSIISNNQMENQVIPGLNYTCSETMPEYIEIFYDSSRTDELGNSILGLRKDISILKNNLSLFGSCSYNLKPGEKASEFSCEGSFVVENKRISDAGVIQEKDPRTVTYNMNFDDSSCEIVKKTTWSGNMGVLKCKILTSSCKWKYGGSSGYYDIKEV